MPYTYTPQPQTAVPGKSFGSPKTHGPGSRLSNPGHRYYQPETGRWASRDPAMELGNPANLAIKLYIELMLEEKSGAIEKVTESLAANEPVQWLMVCGNNWVLFACNDPINRVDLLGLLTKKQCEKIREMLEYEKKHGTKATADKYSNTWGSDSMGSDFDNAPIETATGVLDLDWFTDLRSYRARALTVDTIYTAGKITWNAARLKWATPYKDPKEAKTVEAIKSGKNKYSDLFPPDFMDKNCPKECKK